MSRTVHNDLDSEAAAITIAMIRYDQANLPVNTLWAPVLAGRLGEAGYCFFPELDLVTSDRVVPYLSELSKPILIAAMGAKGMIAVWPRSALEPQAMARLDYNLTSQQRALEKGLEGVGALKDVAVRVESLEENLTVSVAGLRLWSRTYAVHIGWSVLPPELAAPGPLRLVLQRTDGSAPPGFTCPLPPQA